MVLVVPIIQHVSESLLLIVYFTYCFKYFILDSYVLVGGNPNVALPRQKYLDSLTRSGQPTHFAVRLAELTFGDEVLRASTVTGAKPGTLQLDPAVIDAIQSKCYIYLTYNERPSNTGNILVQLMAQHCCITS